MSLVDAKSYPNHLDSYLKEKREIMMSTLSFSGSGNRKKQSPLARPASEEINAERRLKTMADLWTKVVKNTSVRYWSPFEHTWPPCDVGPMHVQ